VGCIATTSIAMSGPTMVFQTSQMEHICAGLVSRSLRGPENKFLTGEACELRSFKLNWRKVARPMKKI
jgi:hypothetical protein